MLTASALAAGMASCVFELGAVVVPGAGGSGGLGSGGAGSGGPTHQVTIQLQPPGIQGALTDFVVMVRLDASRIDYALTQDGGQDLRFSTLDGGAPLPHEIERWDETGESIVWVKLPTLDASTSGLLMRFGDAAAADAQDPPAVWSAFEAVYHLADDLGSGASVRDSTGAHDATASNVAATAGRAGQGFAFDGVASRVDIASITAFDVEPGQGRTFSVLLRRNTTAMPGMSVFGTKTICCSGWGLLVLADQYANVRCDIRLDAGGCCAGASADFGAVALPNGSDDVDWHHVLVTVDRVAGTTAMYHDGAAVAADVVPTAGNMLGGTFHLGVDEYDANFWLGDLDEVRIASSAVSAEWAALAFRSLNDSLLTFGPPVAIDP
jgi:hypothetical protein